MKSQIVLVLLMLVSLVQVRAQVGINSSIPNSSLDVSYSGDNKVPDGVQVPRITLKQLTDKESAVYKENQLSSIIYITDISEGNTLDARININQIGFYFFNGSVWVKLDHNTNIYNTDGTLSSDRNMVMSDKKLTITNSGNNVLDINGASGNIGVGKIADVNSRFLISATSDPLKLEGVKSGNIDNDKILAISSDGVIKEIGTGLDLLSKLSIPTPALFVLKENITDFLKDQIPGQSKRISMTLVKNKIQGLTYDKENSLISLPSGTYQIAFTYEALHNAPGCTLSSYYFHFPDSTRIHTTAAHNEGTTSNHGGTISYILLLSSQTDLAIHLGRGQSGNCRGAGMTLQGNSTQLLIYKIGDI